MIRLLRVDEKLLHGAVVFSWVENLKIQSILIADDMIANDKFMSMTFGLSKPSNVELSILDMQESIAFIKGHISDSIQLMVITGNLQSAKEILQAFPEIRALNIGYLHEFGEGEKMNDGVHFTPEELQICHSLAKKGVSIEFRQRYQDKLSFFEDRS